MRMTESSRRAVEANLVPTRSQEKQTEKDLVLLAFSRTQ